MSQQKVLSAGFRNYVVKGAAVTDAQTSVTFDQLAERFIIRNLGTSDAKVRFNHALNDQITVKAGDRLDLPNKGNVVYYVCPTAAQTTTLEIIGYYE
jgi:hypothetical protein